MDDIKAAGDRILRVAQKFVDGLNSKHIRASWRDYETFKSMLISAGCYGRERELVKILKL